MASSGITLCPDHVHVVEVPAWIEEVDSVAGMIVFFREDHADEFIAAIRAAGLEAIDHGRLPLLLATTGRMMIQRAEQEGVRGG